MGRGQVTGFTFSPAAKATLGARFMSLVETGRFKYWAGEEKPLSDGWWFFQQARTCTYSLPEGGRFETALRWGVPASAKIDTPLGKLPVHDDRLVSAALGPCMTSFWPAARCGRAGPEAPSSPHLTRWTRRIWGMDSGEQMAG